MTPEEAAWAAGLIEGEGCFSLTGPTAVLILQMTDEEPVRRLASLCPGARVSVIEPKKSNHKPLYRMYLGGWVNLAPVADAIRPWLCVRRRNKLDEVLAKCSKARRKIPKVCRRCKVGQIVRADLCQECLDKVT